MAIAFSCPGCQVEFQVPDSLVGQPVRCPTCRAMFDSSRVGLTPLPAPASTDLPPVADEPASAHVISDPEGEYVPCPMCAEMISGHALICPFCRESMDHRPRWRRRDVIPHRGSIILVIGILSLVAVVGSFCPLFSFLGVVLGATAWLMGNHDLARIIRGEMDPDGQQSTKSGRNCGIIGVCLNALVFLACFAWIALNVAAFGLR